LGKGEKRKKYEIKNKNRKLDDGGEKEGRGAEKKKVTSSQDKTSACFGRYSAGPFCHRKKEPFRLEDKRYTDDYSSSMTGWMFIVICSDPVS
jgi:hypothetical protein